MSLPQPILASIPAASAAIAAVIIVLIWQSRDSTEEPSFASPSMTLEGVIALVSREHLGCPDQPALVLTAEGVYEGDGKWRVSYREYEWLVDESDGSVDAVGEPLPCPGR
jgi:hypothetical protein